MIELHRVTRAYATPAGRVAAVDDVSLNVGAGELVALTGRSGSGKSTLLNLIAGIDVADSGVVRVDGQVLDGRSERTLARWRGATVGVVFQFFQLLPTLTIAENVMLPMDFLGTRPARERYDRAMQLLARVGIADQARKLPMMLSGGQQQRVAIARALANDPAVITADEPTGNLDTESADLVLALFSELAAAGTTIVLATHERDIADIASDIVELRDGRIVTSRTFEGQGGHAGTAAGRDVAQPGGWR